MLVHDTINLGQAAIIEKMTIQAQNAL